jgi:putative membrane protein
MIADAMLSTAHFIAVFLLIAALAIEFSLLRGPLNAESIKRLAMADRGYGMAAVLVIAAGVSRVYFGLKDESYYFQLHSFWTKIGVFVLVGLISIWPTIRILAWARASKGNAAFTPPPGEVKALLRLVIVQACLIVLIVVNAALMARGIG